MKLLMLPYVYSYLEENTSLLIQDEESTYFISVCGKTTFTSRGIIEARRGQSINYETLELIIE